MEPGDRIIQGMAADGDFRIVAARTTDVVDIAREVQDLSPLAADALGRALTGAVLLARLLEKERHEEYMTLRFEGKGPLGTLIAEASSGGGVRGYVANPQYQNPTGDVGEALGHDGILTVIRNGAPDSPPYTSQVSLVSGQVAKDLAHYLLTSEQIPSAVLLGVLNRPGGVSAAGGIIVQAFPHAAEESVIAMEKRIRHAPPLSTMLDVMTIEQTVHSLFDPLGYKQLDAEINVPVEYSCTCNRERALRQFRHFSPQELGEMIREEDDSVATCQFCGRRYVFTSEDLLGLDGAADA
ncbi:MAG: Hsp33 family molecular chaperone HslO [Thermoanaerobaculia bacterium]